ncbi:MAG: FG-GAP-like repeat-containing protein, partial [Candidatus Eisenbacteria bacterium]|nr:FG-GAP-like repeat-containing protein [Candidatus Eisenbacteria bacterium]
MRGGTNPTAFGWSVLACDLTGDGRSDLLIGEPYYDDGSNQNRGQVILYLGTATGLSLFPLWGRVGEIDNGNLGYALASAGDVNGDGREDLLIGEPGYGSDPSQEQEGRIHLFVAPLTLQGGPAWTKEGGKADARLGSVVARAGDVTGDGFADFLGCLLYTSDAADEFR